MLAEILALHEANRAGGLQIYPSCVQVQVTSNGGSSPPGGIGWPSSYTSSSPGIIWNLYEGGPDPNSYVAPGGSVWSGGAGGSVGKVG